MTHRVAEVSAALQGRYAIERELGRGGMATVYLAEDLRLHRRVALKLLHPELGSTLGPERFQREIAIAARLTHPHILPLYESGDAGGRLFYAMPYVEGESLRQRLQRESQLPIEETVRIACAVAAALAYAHQAGIIHRDIKPENILLARDAAGGLPHPFVADFGIARAVDVAGGDRLTETGLALGTPSYMSPEQAAASHRLDGRSDLYALGCVVYEMLAGAPPFTGPTAQSVLARHAVDPVPPLRTVRATVPEGVAYAIERALAKVPADRFATAAEFAQALVAKETPPRPAVRRRLDKRAVVLLGIVAIAAVVGATLLRGSSGPVVVPSAASIAVLPLFPAAQDTGLAHLGRDLAVTIGASIQGVGGIQTVDRLSVASATAGLTTLSPRDAAGLARRLGASSVLRGTLVGSGDQVRLDLGLYRVADLAPIAEGISVTARRDSLGALTDSATWALLRQVWVRGDAPSPSLDAVTTRSLPALRAFLDGEREIVKDRWEEAALAYRSAFTSDSTFALARFQYVLARNWRREPVEPEVLAALRRDRDRGRFAEREQLLVDAFLTDSAAARIERHRRVTERYPRYWPGWFLLADMLVHTGPLVGHDWSEGLDALHRAAALDPDIVPVWQHIFSITVGKDSAETSRALARLTELGWPGPEVPELRLLMRLWDEVGRGGGAMTPRAGAVADSVARLFITTDDRFFTVSGAPLALLQRGFPGAQIDLNRRVLRLRPADTLAVIALDLGSAWAWASRGQWDSALAVMARVAEAHPGQFGLPVVAIENYGLAVLGAWLGATAPDLADRRRASALAAIGGLSLERDRRFARGRVAWFDGILGFARRDRRAIQAARVAALRSGDPQANLIERSLGAFELALTDRKGAGLALAELEEQCLHQDAESCNSFTPHMALQRFAAGDWLRESGETRQASRLLLAQDAAGPPWDGWWWTLRDVLAAPSFLARARLADSEGSTKLARYCYAQFLQRYDALSPPPAIQSQVDEARAALRRLAGTEDRP